MMLFSTKYYSGMDIPKAYCQSVNQQTGKIKIFSFDTNFNYWPTTTSIPTRFNYENNSIARAFFLKNQNQNLPGNMEENKIYYLRKTGTDIKIYTTFQNAVNETQNINFTASSSGYLFFIYFLDTAFRFVNAWKPAELAISDIPCCPPLPEYNLHTPSTANITYNGQQINIKLGAPGIGGNIYSPNWKDIYQLKDGGICVHDDDVVVEFDHSNPNIPFQQDDGPSTWYLLFKASPPVGFGDIPFLSVTGFRQIFDSINNAHYWDWLGQASYLGTSDLPNTSSFEYAGDSFVDGPNGQYGFKTLLPWIKSQGILPETIDGTMSGSIDPPNKLRLYLPDSYFPNGQKPISIGLIDEILTFDPNTMAYWSDVLTYAGIPGRLHWLIPDFYPLNLPYNRYIISSSSFNKTYLPGNQLYYLGGDFDEKLLNSYENSEIKLYESIYTYTDSSNWPLLPKEIINEKFKLFVGNDSHGGYPTNLPQGSLWLDSRVHLNLNPELAGRTVTKNNYKFMISFSKWESAKFNKIKGVRATENETNHFGKNFYAIHSVHPDAHITSLGV